MRTRLLAAVAVLAGALLVPSAALAAPVLVTPAAPIVTKDATPIDFTWTDDGTNNLFQVVSGDPSGGICPAMAAPRQPVSGIILSTDTLEYQFTPSVDGTSCYYVEGSDGMTITASAPVLITYDTQPPAGAITSPAIVHTTADALSATASDAGSGVDSVTFERSADGIVWTPVDTDSSAPYTADWDTSDGVYLVHAVITDNLGNPSFTTPDVSLRIDRTHPAVSVTAPAASTPVHGTSVTVSADASDGGSGVAQVDFFAQGSGGPISLGSDTIASAGSYGVLWNTTTGSFPDGLYTVWAVATDNATLTTTSAVVGSVRVDNTAPSVSVTAPASSSNVRGASVTVSANASDGGSGVAQVDFFAQGSGGPISLGSDTIASAGSYSVLWNTTTGSSPDGLYTVWAVATDNVTLTTTSTVVANVRVDNTAPAGALTVPIASANLGGAVNALSATASDGGSGVFSVRFESSTNGSSWSPIVTSGSSGSPYTANWNTASQNAALLVHAVITDNAGNVFTTTPAVSVTVDNTPPNAPVAPTGISPVSASPTITFSSSTDVLANGVQSGVNHYDVYRDGVKVNAAPIAVGTGGPYNWSDAAGQSLNLPSGTPPHTYSYTVKAVDGSGNVSVASAPHLIVVDAVDASAPTSMTALASPTSQRPQVSWGPPSWITPAFAIDHYKVYRNGIFVTDVSGTTFTDNQPSLPDNTYSYQVVAGALSDAPVGVASATVAIIYDTTAPAAPAGLAASPALDGSIGISWIAANDGSGSGVARYVVRRSLSSVPPVSVADGDATCQGAATSCIDATALNGKLYSYAVFAIDRAGNTSLAGTAVGVTARDQLAPAVPQGLSATPSDASVALKWAAAGPDDDVAGYVLVAKQGAQAPTSETDGTRVCVAIAATSASCVATGLTNGATYTFGLFALDEALNRSQPAVVSAAPNGKVTDLKAPAAVSKLKAKVSGHKVTLTWKNPADHDFDHVEITAGERKPATVKASKRVYSGKGTTAATTLAAGQSRWFVVVAYDAVGNASGPASVHITIAAPSKFGPAPHTRVHGTVKLSWPVAKGARYYNVQVYAGKKRILVSWPAGRALQLPSAKLKRGTTYTWYVWPGLGAKTKAHYGKLIGRNVFTFSG